MTTELYLLELETPSADKVTLIVEASSPEEAKTMAEAEAIDIGALDEEELEEEDPECYFTQPILIPRLSGKPNIAARIE